MITCRAGAGDFEPSRCSESNWSWNTRGTPSGQSQSWFLTSRGSFPISAAAMADLLRLRQSWFVRRTRREAPGASRLRARLSGNHPVLVQVVVAEFSGKAKSVGTGQMRPPSIPSLESSPNKKVICRRGPMPQRSEYDKPRAFVDDGGRGVSIPGFGPVDLLPDVFHGR